MKRIILATSLVLLSLAATALAQGWGEVREPTVNLKVREGRSVDSAHLETLPAGRKVRVDFLENGWFAVFALDAVERDENAALGYVSAAYLRPVVDAGTSGETAGAEATDAPAKTVSEVVETGQGEIKAPVEVAPPASTSADIDPSRIPVKISSDRMTYDESGKVVSFEGNVLAEHGELQLTAEKLSAYFVSSEAGQFSADSVERIVALGDVVVTRGRSEGRCEKVTYFVQEQLLRLEGDPILKDGPNSLTGKVINFYLRENRSEVVGGEGKRVRAIFLAPDDIKGQ